MLSRLPPLEAREARISLSFVFDVLMTVIAFLSVTHHHDAADHLPWPFQFSDTDRRISGPR